MSTLLASTHMRIRAQRSDITWIGYGIAFLGFLVVTMAYGMARPIKLDVFGTYWAAGRAATAGLNPYAVYPETLREDFTPYGHPVSLPDLNLNPPFTLPLFHALSHLTIEHFVTAWMLITALCFVVGTALLIRNQPQLQVRQVAWLLLSNPTLVTFGSGQTYGLIFLLCVLAWLLQKRGNNIGAAIAIGLVVSIKPTMIFWPVLLFIAGHRKLAMQSLGVFVATSLLPLPIYGAIVYREWLAALAHDPHWMTTSNLALIPFFTRLGFRFVGIISCIAVALCLAGWAWREKPDFAIASGTGICAAILCAPLGWHNYVLFLAPFFVMRRWKALPTLAASIFMFPGLSPFLVAQSGVVYVVTILAILCYFLRQNYERNVAEYPPPAAGAAMTI